MATSRRKPRRSNALTTPINVSPEALAALSKPREGFAQHADALFALYADNAVELSIKGQTPANAMAELDAYRTLVQMERDAQRQLARISETRALRGAHVWSTMLDIYARARSAGRNDIQMLRAISDFAHFMKHKAKRPASTAGAATPRSRAAPQVA